MSSLSGGQTARQRETIESGGVQRVESWNKQNKRIEGQNKSHHGRYYATKAATAAKGAKAAKTMKAAKVHFEFGTGKPSWCMSKERGGGKFNIPAQPALKKKKKQHAS